MARRKTEMTDEKTVECVPARQAIGSEQAGGRGNRRVTDGRLAATSSDRIPVHANRGAPRSIGSGAGGNISLSHAQLITAVTEKYLHEQLSYRDAHLKTLRAFFHYVISADDKRYLTKTAPESIRTYRQFMYWSKLLSPPKCDTAAVPGTTVSQPAASVIGR
jgi:hypothetical protein